MKTVMMAARPNAAVQGGAGASLAGLRRLGWKSPSPHSVVTRDGTVLFFGGGPAPEGVVGVDPRTVLKWANDDLQTALALQSQVARDINEVGGARGYGREDRRAGTEENQRGRMFGNTAQEQASANLWRRGRFEVVKEQIVPWFEPMARVMRTARRKGQRAAASAMRACVEGGWWTQSRRYSAGAAANDRCACGAAAGTLWHKLGECEKGEEWRTAHCKAEVLKQRKGALWDPLYSRGVPAKPKPVREVKSWARWRAAQRGQWWSKMKQGKRSGVWRGRVVKRRHPFIGRSSLQCWKH